MPDLYILPDLSLIILLHFVPSIDISLSLQYNKSINFKYRCLEKRDCLYPKREPSEKEQKSSAPYSDPLCRPATEVYETYWELTSVFVLILARFVATHCLSQSLSWRFLFMSWNGYVYRRKWPKGESKIWQLTCIRPSNSQHLWSVSVNYKHEHLVLSFPVWRRSIIHKATAYCWICVKSWIEFTSSSFFK